MSKIIYFVAGGIIYYFVEFKYHFFSNFLSSLSWTQKILILVIGFIFSNLLDKWIESLDKDDGNDNNNFDDDIFFDKAPNPLPPPTLPPAEDQLEFTEFMKKMEQEKDKVPVKRE